ncbi:sulfatase-like hydrolase/transferase [Roseibium sp.]|uniref:sulfatase-like hydrolase/transferase n=1 Tax=Roseibium sp. TaxID=1936156 RepID=UPI003D0A62D3
MQSSVNFVTRLRENGWLSRETLLFATLPILFPNFIYLAAYDFYSPPRLLFIVLLAMACLAGLLVNRYIFFVLLLSVVVLDALVFTGYFFQMPLMMIVDSVRYAGNLSAFLSVPYVAAVTVLICTFGLTYVTVRKLSPHRDRIRLVPFVAVLTIFCALDLRLNPIPEASADEAGQVTGTYVPIKDAASIHSRLAQSLAQAKQPNMLVVVVEGLGALQSKEKQDLIFEPLLGDRVVARYSVESGTTHYTGSTTSGEIRELCNLKADYRDFRERESEDCLPNQAAKAGYRTVAFHAFTKHFFERKDWYPKIGFQEMNFLENNAGLETEEPLRRCGSTFRGLCDVDVAKAVKASLTNGADGPIFVYWLTLNSHKPVQVGEVPGRLSCDDGGVFEDRELCLMGEQWLNVAHLVKDIALTEGLADTEILLVGDHNPPLTSRDGRAQFQSGRVAWLHLKPKSKAQIVTAAPSVSVPVKN